MQLKILHQVDRRIKENAINKSQNYHLSILKLISRFIVIVKHKIYSLPSLKGYRIKKYIYNIFKLIQF